MRSIIDSIIPVSLGDPYAMLKSFPSHMRDAMTQQEGRRAFWEEGLVPLLMILAWGLGEVIVWAVRKNTTTNSKTKLKRWLDS